MYQSLKRKGLAPQFEHAGIYAILLDGNIVYIGKSVNMLQRMAQHYVGICKQAEPKYQILAEAKRNGHQIRFTVLHYAKEQTCAARTEELGQKEGEFIRRFLPALNTQIPKEANWRKWDVQEIDTSRIFHLIQ